MNRCHAKNSRLAQREFLFHSDRVLETDAVVCAFIWRSVPGTVIFWHHLLLGWHLESLGLVSCMYSVVKGHHHEETPLFHPGEVCQGPTGCYFVRLGNLYLLRHRRGVKGFYRRGRISCVEAITDGPSTPLCYSSSNIWESAYIPVSLYYIQPRQTWPDKIQWSPSKAEAVVVLQVDPHPGDRTLASNWVQWHEQRCQQAPQGVTKIAGMFQRVLFYIQPILTCRTGCDLTPGPNWVQWHGQRWPQAPQGVSKIAGVPGIRGISKGQQHSCD